MAEKIVEKNTPKKLSPTLRRVVSKETRLQPPLITGKLSQKELQSLHALISTPADFPDVRLGKAMASLTERVPSPETAQLFDQVIADLERPVAQRRLAAIMLGRMPEAIAEPILIRHMAAPDATVQFRVLQALGHLGSAETLKELDRLPEPQTPMVAKQWQFARLLIRHRLGLAEGKPARLRGTNWRTDGARDPEPLPVQAMDAESLAACYKSLGGKYLGVELAGDSGLAIATGDTTSYLLLAKELNTGAGRKRPAKTPSVAGVIARWDERTGTAIVHQVILATPYDRRILLRGYHLDGTEMFEGICSIRNADLASTLTSCELAGQCRFRIVGRMDAKGFSISTAETLGRNRPRTTRS